MHHKNYVKTDNRLQNLVYLTRAEHRKLHMIGKKYKLGKKHTDQSKAKMRAAHNKKQVYCVELDRVFESISAVSKELSLRSGHISHCCKGKRKTCGGYHFEYYNGDSDF